MDNTKIFYKIIKFKQKFYFFLVKKNRSIHCLGKISITTPYAGKSFIKIVFNFRKLAKFYRFKGFAYIYRYERIKIFSNLRRIFILDVKPCKESQLLDK